MSLKVIVGAGRVQHQGWISLERNDLDIRSSEEWRRLFVPGTVSAVLSEHVLEHLTPDEARDTAANIYEVLEPGGYWRIAVPDANNRDPVYQEYCRPGGAGQRRMEAIFYAADEPAHKVHYNIESLAWLLSSAGFQTYALEWYDEQGQFHQGAWSPADGPIKRSAGKFYLLVNYLVNGCWDTSLIVDAVKNNLVN